MPEPAYNNIHEIPNSSEPDEKKETPFYTRRLDDLGRLALPGDIRKFLDWGYGTEVEIELLDVKAKKVLIRQAHPDEARDHCAVCHRQVENMSTVNGAQICDTCIEAIRGDK